MGLGVLSAKSTGMCQSCRPGHLSVHPFAFTQADQGMHAGIFRMQIHNETGLQTGLPGLRDQRTQPGALTRTGEMR